MALGTGLLNVSRTRAVSEEPNAVFTEALCGLPELIVTEAGAPALFVREKLAGDAAPATEAVIAYVPAVVLAVGVILAKPAALVMAVELDKVALAPLPGEAKVTVALGTGLFPASLTRATIGANAVPTVTF